MKNQSKFIHCTQRTDTDEANRKTFWATTHSRASKPTGVRRKKHVSKSLDTMEKALNFVTRVPQVFLDVLGPWCYLISFVSSPRPTV